MKKPIHFLFVLLSYSLKMCVTVSTSFRKAHWRATQVHKRLSQRVELASRVFNSVSIYIY